MNQSIVLVAGIFAVLTSFAADGAKKKTDERAPLSSLATESSETSSETQSSIPENLQEKIRGMKAQLETLRRRTDPSRMGAREGRLKIVGDLKRLVATSGGNDTQLVVRYIALRADQVDRFVMHDEDNEMNAVVYGFLRTSLDLAIAFHEYDVDGSSQPHQKHKSFSTFASVYTAVLMDLAPKLYRFPDKEYEVMRGALGYLFRDLAPSNESLEFPDRWGNVRDEISYQKGEGNLPPLEDVDLGDALTLNRRIHWTRTFYETDVKRMTVPLLMETEYLELVVALGVEKTPISGTHLEFVEEGDQRFLKYRVPVDKSESPHFFSGSEINVNRSLGVLVSNFNLPKFGLSTGDVKLRFRFSRLSFVNRSYSYLAISTGSDDKNLTQRQEIKQSNVAKWVDSGPEPRGYVVEVPYGEQIRFEFGAKRGSGFSSGYDVVSIDVVDSGSQTIYSVIPTYIR